MSKKDPKQWPNLEEIKAAISTLSRLQYDLDWEKRKRKDETEEECPDYLVAMENYSNQRQDFRVSISWLKELVYNLSNGV